MFLRGMHLESTLEQGAEIEVHASILGHKHSILIYPDNWIPSPAQSRNHHIVIIDKQGLAVVGVLSIFNADLGPFETG